jgi:hypothetical protein
LICVLMALFAQPAIAAEWRDACDWDRPGHAPYSGAIADAVDDYTDLPADVRARLKARLVSHQFDDVVTIRRESMTGRREYEPVIRDMHFGAKAVCHVVTRTHWPTDHEERGLVYCDGDTCLLVPIVCRNVSRILPLIGRHAGVAGGFASGEAAPLAPATPSLEESDFPVTPQSSLPPELDAFDDFPPPAAGWTSFVPASPGVGAGWPSPEGPPGFPPTPPIVVPPLGGGDEGPPCPGTGSGIPAVPEPASWVMFSLVLVLLAWRHVARPATH